MQVIVKDLKRANQDFEWYPTTQKMIDAVVCDVSSLLADKRVSNCTVLEIGAGDGRVGKAISNGSDRVGELLAIEKSELMISKLWSEGIPVIGSDFLKESLLDKRADIVFCNPPYSEYIEWVEKIITESNAIVYLIIPQRWRKNGRLQDALRDRGVKDRDVKSILLDDFSEGDRKARAKIEIVRIRLDGIESIDSKDLFFDRFIFSDIEDLEGEHNTEIVGKGIKDLVVLYEKELNEMIIAYRAIGKIGTKTLKEIGIKKETFQKAFYEKIKELKRNYWRGAFEKLDSIRRYLTQNSINRIWETMEYRDSIDFTEKNIYMIAKHFVEKANKYKDKQLITLFDEMFSQKNIKSFKSTKNIYDCNTRWESIQKSTHYYLTNRIVIEGSYSRCNFRGLTLSESGKRLIRDIKTILYTMGWVVTDRELEDYSFVEIEANREYRYHLKKDYSKIRLRKGAKTTIGKVEDVFEVDYGYQYLINGTYYHGKLVTTDGDIAFRVKFFKNGNVHININKKIMDTLNVEFARLKGWIHSREDAKRDMGIDTPNYGVLIGVLEHIVKTQKLLQKKP
jgi:hypothetical protein